MLSLTKNKKIKVNTMLNFRGSRIYFYKSTYIEKFLSALYNKANKNFN